MPQGKQTTKTPVSDLDIQLNRDVFLRNLLRELAGTLEEVIGLDEASGFVSIVGQHIGEWINNNYREQLKVNELNRDQIKDVLVDFKRRINGDFYIISADKEKIVLGNRACPFGDKVKGRPSLCMMTTNVFGTITADNMGYAKVILEKTIARGDQGCQVIVYLSSTEESENEEGNEFYRST